MTSNVAVAFKSIREAKGLTQEELAEVLGVTAGHIGMIEQGRARPSYEVMDKLVNEFKFDANILFDNAGFEDETISADLVQTVRNMHPGMKQMLKIYNSTVDQLSSDFTELMKNPDK